MWENAPIPAEGAADLGHGVDDPGLVGHVAVVGHGGASTGDDRFDRLLETLLHHVEAGHRRTLGGQTDGGGAPDA